MERGRIPPVERKRKEEGKKERHPNKKALELIERGYKSEHKSLTSKKTLCVTVRKGYVRKQHKVAVVRVFFWEGGWRDGGGGSLRRTDRCAEAGREG